MSKFMKKNAINIFRSWVTLLSKKVEVLALRLQTDTTLYKINNYPSLVNWSEKKKIVDWSTKPKNHYLNLTTCPNTIF